MMTDVDNDDGDDDKMMMMMMILDEGGGGPSAVMMTDVDNDMEKVDFSGRNPKIDGTGIFSGSQFTTNIFFALFWAIFQCQCALQ